MIISAPASIASSASASEPTSTSRRRLNPPTSRACWIAAVIEPTISHEHQASCIANLDLPDDHMWLSFNIIMLERSWRWGSMPPTSIPYFSTSLNPTEFSQHQRITKVIKLTWRCFTCSSNCSCKSITSSQILDPLRSTRLLNRRDRREGYRPYFVAIPLHRARRLRATRSPRSKKRAFPFTVAMCFTGSKTSPSLTCHSTLWRVADKIRRCRKN